MCPAARDYGCWQAIFSRESGRISRKNCAVQRSKGPPIGPVDMFQTGPKAPVCRDRRPRAASLAPSCQFPFCPHRPAGPMALTVSRSRGRMWAPAPTTLRVAQYPLRVSQVALFACDGSRPLWTASTLGLRLDNRISPICGSSPPGPPRPVCARMAALPIPPFSKWGHGLLIPARLSSRTHIGRTQWTYSIIELSPARTGPPERRRACADWRRCRKSPHFDVHFRKIIIFQQAAFFAHCACFLIKSGANSVKIQSIPVDNGRLQSA